MSRLRSNFQRGSLSANAGSGDTSLSSGQFSALPVVASPDYLMIVLDPDAQHGNPEIVKVTAHTSSATTVTVTRGQEGTSARSHNSSTTWLHGPTSADWAAIRATATDAVLYVSNDSSASDNNDGLSWGSAFATLGAAQTALPAAGGTIHLGGGVSVPTAFTLQSRQHLIGPGAGVEGASGSERGSATLTSTIDGPVISVAAGAQGWSIENLTINGDRTKTSQILLTIGSLATGVLRNVDAINAGLHSCKFSGINCHVDNCQFLLAKNLCLYITTDGSNNNKFTKCKIRVSDHWGLWIESATTDNHFDTCDIEGNNQAAGAYGGCYFNASGTALFTSCHFESNTAGTGTPLQQVQGVLTEILSTYSESRPVLCDGGKLTSLGIDTNLAPHASVGSTSGTVFLNPYKSGGGTFYCTDNSLGHLFTLDGSSTAPITGLVYESAALLPTGALAHTAPRSSTFANAGGLSTGLEANYLIYLRAGTSISNVSFFSGATPAGTPVNQWFALRDASLNKLAVSADDLDTAWAATSQKTLPLARIVTDAAITSGAATLTSATAAFTSADTGKKAVVVGAGAASGLLGKSSSVVTMTYVNSTTVTLSANAGTTVTGATAYIGTPYVVPSSGWYYLGAMVKATTVPTLTAAVDSSDAGIKELSPWLGSRDASSVTTPATAVSQTSAGTKFASVAYAYVS